jgi:hypothetical protein
MVSWSNLGRFRKVAGGWQGYVIHNDGHAALIIISDVPVNSTQTIEDLK